MIIFRSFIGLTLFLIFLFSISCVGHKESKRIKKGSKVIRDSEILLGSNFQGPASSYSFYLRKNNFFDYNVSTMMEWDYYAGTWNMKNDSIYLEFIDGHKMNDLNGRAYIDKAENRLYLEKKDGRTTFLDIFINKLK